MTDVSLKREKSMSDVVERSHPASAARGQAARPAVAVVVPSDRVAEIFLQSDALATLAKHVELRFIASPEVTTALPAPCERLTLPSLGGRLRRRLDHHMWNHALFCHLRQHRIDDTTSFKAVQLRPIVRLVHRWLAHRAVARTVSLLDREVLFRRDREAVRYLRLTRPSVLLAPGSAIDSYSHMVVRSAKCLGIPTAMIVTHWDYFSKKGLLRVAPERIYVWGEDMARLAVDRNGVDAHVVRVVGAPQFEKYRQMEPQAQRKARADLGFPDTGALVLFAGTATPYDELSVLRELSEVAGQPEFSGCRLIYRPHPRAWKRKYAQALDPAALPNVLLDSPTAPDATSDRHYAALIAAVDGVASPFSTMILEGAVAGKAAFCVAFSDEVNDWKFAEANNTEHIQSIAQRAWLTVCRDRRRLRSQFADYLALLHRGTAVDDIRRDIGLTVYSDGRHYAQRLYEQMEADFSLGARGTPALNGE